MERTATHDILLVEQSAPDRYLIQQAIVSCGAQFHVWPVSNGSQALAFLRHEPPFEKMPTPALILLNLHLPDRDTRTFLTEARGLAPYHMTPIVILGRDEPAVEELYCQVLGASAYVQKATNFSTYYGRVQALIHTWLGADGSSF